MEDHSNRSIAKSAGIISFATLCSRTLGFARDVVIAHLFGVYVYAQAFVVAFKIPNLFRDLLAEGAANAAIVPVFSEYCAKKTKEEFWELANIVLNLLLVIVTAVALLGIWLSPLLVRLIAPGFISDPLKLQATITLTRIIFPYILLISLAAYCMGLLNSLKHFAVPAFAPCLLNISIIFFALLFGEGIKGLASGVLVGGALQLAVQIPVLYKKGFRLRLPRTLSHPTAKTIGLLMLPRLLGSCIYQLNNFVDSIFGSLSWIVGEGGVAILYFSYRLILFPLGIFSTALAQAILPTFSTLALEDSHERLKDALSFGLRANFFMLLPASLGFMVLARPIISALFEGGKFDAYSTALTANALFFYSIGLAAYGANRLLQNCFFSLQDTVTPTKNAFLCLVLNIILNSLLMFPLKISGLALATSVSGVIGFLVLFFNLKKRLSLKIAPIGNACARIFLASVGMALTCFILQKIMPLAEARVVKILYLGITIFTGVAAYIFFCFLLRVREMKQLFIWLKKRG